MSLHARHFPLHAPLRFALVAALYMLMTIVILGMIPWQEVRESRALRLPWLAPYESRAEGRVRH